MLERIEGLSPLVDGVRASGRVTRDDYERVLVPLLEERRARGERIRFLYEFGPDFTNFTASAAAEDFRVGLRHLRLFERCAVVTDVDWIRHSTQLVGALLPCPVRVFGKDQRDDAVAWLGSPDAESKLAFELRDEGVLIVRPQGPLRREDFDKLASVVDPWIERHGVLRGLVIAVPKFPGWENVGSLIRHVEFVREHHRKVGRVALAADGTIPDIASKVAAHFVAAEVKSFPYAGLDDAVRWARG